MKNQWIVGWPGRPAVASMAQADLPIEMRGFSQGRMAVDAADLTTKNNNKWPQYQTKLPWKLNDRIYGEVLSFIVSSVPNIIQDVAIVVFDHGPVHRMVSQIFSEYVQLARKSDHCLYAYNL